MGYPHHKRGCIKCGMFRNREDMIEKKYDVYFLDKNSRSLMRIGFCKDCFEKGNFDMKKVRKALHKSEKEFQRERKKMNEAEADEASAVFRDAEFVSSMPFKDFWDQYNEKTVHDFIREKLDAR